MKNTRFLVGMLTSFALVACGNPEVVGSKYVASKDVNMSEAAVPGTDQFPRHTAHCHMIVIIAAFQGPKCRSVLQFRLTDAVRPPRPR